MAPWGSGEKILMEFEIKVLITVPRVQSEGNEETHCKIFFGKQISQVFGSIKSDTYFPKTLLGMYYVDACVISESINDVVDFRWRNLYWQWDIIEGFEWDKLFAASDSNSFRIIDSLVMLRLF